MTYKQKLIDLLKSDDEVRSAIEKLEFGCNIKYKTKYGDKKLGKIISFNKGKSEYIVCNNNKIYETSYIYKIKGLPLQERFLLMFGKNKNINIFISYIGGIWSDNTYMCNYDIYRDFDNQDDEVYSKIYEALYNLTK